MRMHMNHEDFEFAGVLVLITSLFLFALPWVIYLMAPYFNWVYRVMQ